MTGVTGDEALRIEKQDDSKTKAEVMETLRKMYGQGIPDPTGKQLLFRILIMGQKTVFICVLAVCFSCIESNTRDNMLQKMPNETTWQNFKARLSLITVL